MIKEEFINRINALIDKIEEIAAEDDDFKGYKVSPLLKEIVNLLEDNNDKEQDTLGIQFNTYQFVSEVYKRMGRFSLAAKYHEKALDASIVLCTRYNKKLNGIDALLYDILRERNYYVDDDCLDILDKLRGTGLIEEPTINKTVDRALKRRRGLRNDPVEMSEAYLAVIDEIEERIDQNRTIYGMGACFEIWNLKAQYLAEKGISWSSPAILNPRVMFD